jgi:UDP-N-acetyl-D-mannosaminuronic acid dehydrogenase
VFQPHFIKIIKYQQPNIDYVLSATKSIAPFIKSGDLIILESTSPVGTTEKIQQTLIDHGANLKDVHIAYCPERVLPGKIMKS